MEHVPISFMGSWEELSHVVSWLHGRLGNVVFAWVAIYSVKPCHCEKKERMDRGTTSSQTQVLRTILKQN